ncbi:protein kinase [Frankia sp. AgB1.9]|uniref:serine/threonine-protein kinase n=1 Tax=unclassified Frankia TaxID=2632575 RepID=UPI00193148C6|nr:MULTISPECIES: serine/threonine-protein kinase [unclassified Frankia]MBL7491365.1 protein kinase [Frankia sp. AgW1.1]MBL7551766.1 protein kinase [Frankia sp. AgB1.9]MBL7624795.1 protein kinase [Frankia sp. AgB1.8]
MIVDRAAIEAALPGYRLGRQLGRGGYGMVLAGQNAVGRPFAIKVLPSLGPAGLSSEARILAELQHPHVVRVVDFVRAGGIDLIVMELLSGGDLRSRIAQEVLAPEWSCAVVLAVAGALQAAHERGLLHRDVKPENVLFAADGRAKLTDFGVAKIVAGASPTSSTIVGTPHYMPPEQLAGGKPRPTVDVYALGVLGYELLGGRTPFGVLPGLNYASMREAHEYLVPVIPPRIPAPIGRVLLTALARDPADRPQSAKAFALDLAGAARTVFGRDWLARAGTRADLDDDVSVAARSSRRPPASPVSGPVVTATATATAAAAPDAGATAPPDQGPQPNLGPAPVLRHVWQPDDETVRAGLPAAQERALVAPDWAAARGPEPDWAAARGPEPDWAPAGYQPPRPPPAGYGGPAAGRLPDQASQVGGTALPATNNDRRNLVIVSVLAFVLLVALAAVLALEILG